MEQKPLVARPAQIEDGQERKIWAAGLCGCCSSCATCCAVTFCQCITTGQLHQRIFGGNTCAVIAVVLFMLAIAAYAVTEAGAFGGTSESVTLTQRS